MSDLQISLLVSGIAVVVGVYVFNWWQERKFQQRVKRSFQQQAPDVLLGMGDERLDRSEPAERIEPRLGTAVEDSPAPAAESVPPALSARPASPGLAPLDKDSSGIDYIASIEAPQPINAERLIASLRLLTGFDKPVFCRTMDETTARWADVSMDTQGSVRHVRVAIQLANRAGPLSETSLQRFLSVVEEIARELEAKVEMPDAQFALQQAVDLDKFCIDADIAIGINVVSGPGKPFVGTKVRALAEAAGFQLAPEGNFQLRDDSGHLQCSLDNQEGKPFVADQIRSLSTQGVTLVFEVPRVGDGVRAFDRMVEIGRGFSNALGGTLVDDNRAPLGEIGLARIRKQLTGIYAAMEARNIAAGSDAARRLFS